MSDDKINERPSRIGLVNAEMGHMVQTSPAAAAMTRADVPRSTTANWVAFAGAPHTAGAADVFSALPPRHTTQDDSATARISLAPAGTASGEMEMQGLDFELAMYNSLSAHREAALLASLLFDAANQRISGRLDLRLFSPDIFDDVPDKLLRALRGCIRAPYLPEGLPDITMGRWTAALGQAAEPELPDAIDEDAQPPRKRQAAGDGPQPVGRPVVNVPQGVPASEKRSTVQRPGDRKELDEQIDEQIEISKNGVEGRNEAMFKFLTNDPNISAANLTLKLNALSAQGNWPALKETTVVRFCAVLHVMRENPEGNSMPSRVYRLLAANPEITKEEAITELSRSGALSKGKQIDAVRYLNLAQSAINNHYLAGSPGNSVSSLRNQAMAARNLKIFRLVAANPDITVNDIRKHLGDSAPKLETIKSMAIWARSIHHDCSRDSKEASTAAGALHFLLISHPELSFDTAPARAELLARWKACDIKGASNFPTYRSNSLLALTHHVFDAT